MQIVGIKALKDKLSAYVRAVEAGETVLVTDRGKVVAELIPPRTSLKPTTAAEVLTQLERDGILTRASRTPGTAPDCMALATFDELMLGLADDRGDL
jgi:prevent-host-death family protein